MGRADLHAAGSACDDVDLAFQARERIGMECHVLQLDT